jgi:transcription elongation factor Elf1
VRIRTRHKLLKLLIALAVVNYVVFLFDILFNASDLFIWVMLGFVVLIILTLLLYLGVKPTLEEGDIVAADEVLAEAEEPVPAFPPEVPAPDPLPPPTRDEVVEVVEIPRRRPEVSAASMRGPHHYRCPFCSHVFSMEATHLKNRRDIRMSCPYCSNHVRIPPRARIVVGAIPRGRVADKDRAAYRCAKCGEVRRVSAPASTARRMVMQGCANCGSSRLDRAAISA